MSENENPWSPPSNVPTGRPEADSPEADSPEADQSNLGSWDGGSAEPVIEKKNRRDFVLRWLSVVLVAAIVGSVSGVIAAKNTKAGPTSNTQALVPDFQAGAQSATQSATPSTIRSVLEKVQPAVVSIQVGEAAGGTGSGTGMIVSPDGEILTNAHVVSGGTNIQVTLNNGKNAISAHLLGIDTTIDSAMIKLDSGAGNLPTVQFGNSSGLQVGDEVVAIGNALALPGGPSVTTGIVSARDRTVSDSNTILANLLQTDAAINPGNSGGPLANMAGQVVGMNTAVIRGQTGEFQNIGFALAIDTIKPALGDLAAGKVTSSAYLGVSAVTMTPDIHGRFGFTPNQGAVVDSVQQDSPADKAGISRFDVITEVAGLPVNTSEDLVSMVRGKKPGEKVSVTYFKGGKDKTQVSVTLAPRPTSNS